jgi:hypothetical protein
LKYHHIPHCKFAIGLVGPARAGKDSIAKSLIHLLPGAERFALSDHVATICRVCHGMNRRDARLLQNEGTSRREGRPTVWMDALYGLLLDREPEIVVITGLRYAEEVELVRSLAPQTAILRVTRLTAAGLPYVAEDRDPSHPVEQGISDIAADVEFVAKSGDTSGLARQAAAWITGHFKP